MVYESDRELINVIYILIHILINTIKERSYVGTTSQNGILFYNKCT